MRVLLIGASADWSTRDVDRGYTQALKDAGHELVPFNLNNRLKMSAAWFQALGSGIRCGECGSMAVDPDPNYPAANWAVTIGHASESVVSIAVRYDADLVLIISGGSFDPNQAVLLTRVGIPVLTVLTESPYQDEDQKEIAKASTAVGVNERTSVDVFKPYATAFYLPPGYDDTRHTPGDVEERYRSDVVFIGSGFAERGDVLRGVDWSGIDFQVCGFWPRGGEAYANGSIPVHTPDIGDTTPEDPLFRHLVSGPIDNDETVKRYRSAGIVLSLHRTSNGAESIGPRVYEAAACGAFQIVERERVEAVDVFGDSVGYYDEGDSESLERAIRYYLDRPDMRANMAAEALRRVRGHSWGDRWARCVWAIEQFEPVFRADFATYIESKKSARRAWVAIRSSGTGDTDGLSGGDPT